MKKFVSLMLALVMALGLVACGSKDDNNNNETPDDTTKTLVVGTSADYAPFEFMYPDESGEMVFGGIDVDVIKYIAADMGMEVKVENMGFDYLLASLDKGDFDVVIAGLEATEDRMTSADFSKGYYTDIPAMILVKAENADKYQKLADFDGKSVGAQTATTKLDIVNEDMAGANAVSLQLVTDLVNELVNDKIDAIVLDGSVAQQYAAVNDDLAIAAASSELGDALPYCVAVQKGDPKGLLDGINAAIDKMVSEGKVTEFIEAADALADVAVEVSAD